MAVATLVCAALTAAGCSTTPAPADDGHVVRVSAEALYNEAPWVGASPTNIRAASNIAVGTLQGLADASYTYQQQLVLNNQAQQAFLSDPAANQLRSRSLTECVNVGGGRQGGLTCERMGYQAYQAVYAQAPAALAELELNQVEWPPRNEGWTQARQPLLTAEDIANIADAAAGAAQGYGSLTNAAGGAAMQHYMTRQLLLSR
jgi:hypothetical protein